MSEGGDLRLSKGSIDRLREAAQRFGTQQALADATHMPKPTVQKILSGDADPSFGRVARLADALGLSLDYVLRGNGSARSHAAGDDEDLAPIPVHEIEVSAGTGRPAIEAGDSNNVLHLPRAWLRQLVGDITGLRIVCVRGDSQVPELHDGDWLMIDVHQNRANDGVYVVRLDDFLMVKRLQVEGRYIRLKSANVAYPPTTVDLETDGDRFDVIGKAVWSGRRM